MFHRSELWLLLAGLIALRRGVAMVRIGLTLRRLVEQQSIEVSYGEAEGEYIDMLQVTENEDEAQELLRRHVERSLTGARAVVLARNNSADRLEPKTSLAELDGLRESLVGATPRSCLAVRFGRTHSEGGARTPLMNCEICGALPGALELRAAARRRRGHRRRADQPAAGAATSAIAAHLREAVGQAAPVLANLRNLAIAQLRASTDALTGLPNQRAVQDTLKRMVAQATRTISPLAALLLDLDHFKQINDLYGHDRGDEVLAAVGVALRNVVRDSRLRRALRRRGVPACCCPRPTRRARCSSARRSARDRRDHAARASSIRSPRASASRCCRRTAATRSRSSARPTGRCTRPSATAAIGWRPHRPSGPSPSSRPPDRAPLGEDAGMREIAPGVVHWQTFHDGIRSPVSS